MATDAQDGKKIYSDRDEQFAKLSEALKGADYVQLPSADKLYNAVDLIELSVKGGSTVFIAHDDRLARPDWLTKDFKPTEQSLSIDGQPMKLFERKLDKDESLTLGTNTDSASSPACNMYLVLVNGK